MHSSVVEVVIEISVFKRDEKANCQLFQRRLHDGDAENNTELLNQSVWSWKWEHLNLALLMWLISQSNLKIKHYPATHSAQASPL